MGIFIYLHISKSVTQEEWEKVYEETLELMKALPFAERTYADIHNINTICLVRTKEREETDFFQNPIIGWRASGDYVTIREAEDYYIPRHLLEKNTYDPDAGDAIYSIIPSYLNYDWKDERFSKVYYLWGNKTQGEPYHIYLLAVACLITSRLGEKAYVYGDITRGQCKKAVSIANKHLENPIDVPDQCDKDRLYKRISKLDLLEYEKIVLFERLYFCNKDAEYGAFLQSSFPEEAMQEYWKKKFEHSPLGCVSFHGVLKDYLTLGNDLGKVCEYIPFKTEEDYKSFISHVMDTKLHLKEKDCSDVLDNDQEKENPYTIWTLMAQFAFSGAHNKKVDRYIPIEKIRMILNNAIGDKCPVDALIDAYLEEESRKMNLEDAVSFEDFEKATKQDPSELFNQVVNTRLDKMMEMDEQYAVTQFEHLKYYEDGDRILPAIEKSIASCRHFLDKTMEEEKEDIDTLMAKGAHECCEWIIKHNRHILVRDKDWDKVFTNIENNLDSFQRYYPLFRLKIEKDDLLQMLIALLINDDLYAYSKVLAEKKED